MAADSTFRNAVVAGLGAGIAGATVALVGWQLFEFDRALFVYAQALVISFALVVYRLAVWAQRPPTLVLYRRACAMLMNPESLLALLRHMSVRVAGYFALNQFVWRRGLNRWAAHWPIMVGCLMALAIVVPLIFGWVWFETPPHDLHSYKVMLFGQHIRTIPVDGIEAFLAFHGLVWASFPVIAGCSVAIWRRLRDRGDRATQTFGNDFVPLIVLLSIAITGLLMTVSYSFLEGAMHAPLAWIHCAIVCLTLLWLPYSKLFHIPQRTLKLAHMVYEHESVSGGKAECTRCGVAFADQQQVDDLIEIQKRLGYRYELDADQNDASHYQLVCPQCRRASLVVAQGKRWQTVEAT